MSHRSGRCVRAVLAALALVGLGVPAGRADAQAAEESPPDAIYGATASGAGLIAIFDSEATGGAFYVSHLSAPFAEATLSSGPASDAVASYAFDRNAATGLYYIVSSTVQQEGGPAFPEIPNTAAARYPGSPEGRAGLEQVPTEVAAGPGTLGAIAATAEASATKASSLARNAYAEISGVVSVGAQSATATVGVHADSVVSDSRSVVHGLSIAGVLRIGSVVAESHAEMIGEKPVVRTSFRVLDATVNDIPVTIGSDGVRVAGSEGFPGMKDIIATLNASVREALADSGISVRVLQSVESVESGASASTPGLEITVAFASVYPPVEVPCVMLPDQIPPVPCVTSVPGGSLTLVVGRSEASGSFSPFFLPAPGVIPPIPPVPPTITTIIEPGFSSGSGSSGAAPQALSQVAVRRSLPVLGLFGLWQLSAFGTVALAWWRRNPTGVRA